MWDPQKYLAFGDHRGRPFHELIDRVDCRDPRRVVDLGCGPGNLTMGLAQRWPNAVIEASDSSQDMVDASRAIGLDAQLQDARDWIPAADTDVVVSNATLQWIPEHRDLLRRWPSQLASGTWIAVQVPGNFDAPSHAIVRELAATDRWKASLDGLTLRGSNAANPTVDNPADYAGLLSDAGCSVDAWETTYIQRLTGENPVLEWITGTALTPIKTALPEEEWHKFRTELIPLLNAEYPRRADGYTFFEFRRIFVVAQVS